MVITYHGNGCFRVQSGQLSLIVDPQNARMKPDIFIKTLVPWPLASTSDSVSASGSGIAGPGEYEQKGVRIWGFPVQEESGAKFLKTMYVVEMEELRLAFLGHLSATPKPGEFEEFGDIDILFVPAGGKPFLSPDAAAKLVKQLSPKIAIPSFAKSPIAEERGRKAEPEGSLSPSPRAKSEAKEFAKELGQSAEPAEKLVVKQKDLSSSGQKAAARLQVVILKDSGSQNP